MNPELYSWLLPCFFIIAFLHSSVGLAGGSSYTAFMAIFGMPTTIIPSISLSLNTLVSSISSFNFTKNKHLRASLLWPFLLSSIPMTTLGAHIQLPKLWFYCILMITLALCLLRFIIKDDITALYSLSDRQKTLLSLIIGAVLGFLAGCIGIGGGIYLIPCILLFGLGNAKEAAACAAIFILVNSIIGLASKWHLNLVSWQMIWSALLCVGTGGALGSWLGATTWGTRTLKKAIALVLAIACVLLLIKIVNI